MAVIRISGYPGSGKTTLAKKLAESLGYEYHYAGGIFRTMAAERNMSIEEFYIALAVDPAVERDVDNKQKEIMATKDNVIMEGRVAPFLPSPFLKCNILLTVNSREGARRNLARPENKGRTIEEMEEQTIARLEAEDAHYRTLHGIEGHLDQKHFDIVIDTTHLSIEEVFEETMMKLESFLKTD